MSAETPGDHRPAGRAGTPESALREPTAAEETFRTLVDNSPDFIVRYDRDGRRLFVNLAIAQAYGVQRENMIGTVLGAPGDGTPALQIAADSLDLLRRKIREVFDSGGSAEFEMTYVGPQGTRTTHNRLVAERDETGAVASVLTIARDMTALKRIENELAERESRYRDVFDNSVDGLYLLAVTADGRHFRNLEQNPALERMVGIPRSAQLGRLIEEVVPPDVAEAVNAKYRRCVQAGVPIEEEIDLQLPVGHRYFHSTLIPARDDTGRVRRIVGITRDITEQRDSQRQLRLLGHALDTVSDSVMLMVGDDPRFRYVNASAAQSLGYSREELTGGMGMTDIAPDWTPQAWAELAARLATRRTLRFESRHRTREGLVFPVEVTGNLFEFDGDVFNLVICRDITDRKAAEAALADSEERFRLAFDESLTGMALSGIDPASPFGHQRVNRALSDFLGYSQAELLRRGYAALVFPDDAGEARTAVAELMNGRRDTYRAEWRFRHASGAAVWGLVTANVVRTPDGVPLYLLSQVEDITVRKHAEEELIYRALHDELTGLPNRALLLDHIQSAVARAHRTDSFVAVLFLDIDEFKAINDSFGHSAGDEFLVHVAQRITGILRETDTAARIGGDEFVVVCEGLADPSEAGLVAQRIQKALGAEIPVRGRSVAAPVSIGIAISRPHSTAEELLRDADAAMYSAKHRGGRRWEPADASLQAAAMRMLTLEGELRAAIESRELVLHYQPVLDLRTGRIVAVEALVRWSHPTKGLLPPSQFLDVAEQRNLIQPIGAWVLRTACAQAAEWRACYGAAAPVTAVNVSSRQLGNQGLTRQVHEALRTSGLPPDRLCLEITESQLLAIGTSVTTDLRTLADLGVLLAVDDFGTGYAGMGYLRRLPVHELKIDKSFVEGLGVDATDTAITTSMVALGLSLGLTVVAEGIETPEQLQRLRELDCTWGQGWLWHRALTPEALGQLLAAQAAAG